MSRENSRAALTLFDPALLRPALLDAFKKLDPRVQWRNPVMFVVFVGSLFTTAMALAQPATFTAGVALWLWITVLFANFAEAMAEGRSKAQAASLRGLKKKTWSKRLEGEYVAGTPRSAMQWHPLEALRTAGRQRPQRPALDVRQHGGRAGPKRFTAP